MHGNFSKIFYNLDDLSQVRSLFFEQKCSKNSICRQFNIHGDTLGRILFPQKYIKKVVFIKCSSCGKDTPKASNKVVCKECRPKRVAILAKELRELYKSCGLCPSCGFTPKEGSKYCISCSKSDSLRKKKKRIFFKENNSISF